MCRSAWARLSPLAVLSVIRGLPAATRYWIAFSGGPDSHTLLHLLTRLRGGLSGVQIRAVHVNHRLLPEADAWQTHCAQVCRALDVPFEVLMADVRAAGGGPEAEARQARYLALTEVVEADDVLMTAHTLDDQAETVLLQLVRGGGPAGLAGMPACVRFGAGWLARPLLEFSRLKVHEYARCNQLSFVRDPSNEDRRVDRAFLRAEILPRLRSRWPGVVGVIGRVARHQADARALLDDLAVSDSVGVRGGTEGTLSCAGLRALAPERQRNTIRGWLARGGHSSPSTAQLERIRLEVLGARADRTPLVAWSGTEVRRFRDDLFAMRPLHNVCLPVSPRWRLPERKVLAHGELRAFEALGAGIARRVVPDAQLECRLRVGGERCRPAGRGHGQSLKRLFQERRVTPWVRDRVPLIFVNGTLAAVAGHWVCHDFAAAADEPGWVLGWRDFSLTPPFD